MTEFFESNYQLYKIRQSNGLYLIRKFCKNGRFGLTIRYFNNIPNSVPIDIYFDEMDSAEADYRNIMLKLSKETDLLELLFNS